MSICGVSVLWIYRHWHKAPWKRGKKSLCRDFNSCTTWQGLQYRDASKAEWPSRVSNSLCFPQGKKKRTTKKKLQRIRAYREKKKKNKKISYRPHLQAIMHEFFQMKNKIEFTSLKIRFNSFFCKMFKIFYLLFSDFESLFICPVFFSTQER